MVYKKTKKLLNPLILFYFAIFPYGQVLGLLGMWLFKYSLPIQITDVVIAVIALATFYKSRFLPSEIIKFTGLLFFSYIFGSYYLNSGFQATSFLYLARLLLYVYVAYYLIEGKIFVNSGLIVKSLITVGLVAAALGFLQYFAFPDLRELKVFGWDDHYYRLVGTFLDPAFIGILLTITILLIQSTRQKLSKTFRFLSSVFCLIALFLTYSRASYLSLLTGLLVFSVYKYENLRKYLFFVGIFIAILFFLPRPGGEGVKLERTFSLSLRLKNYEETLTIWSKSPLFGIGYNNICEAKTIFLNKQPTVGPISHSCNGADNSLLFFLATTGIVGVLFVFKSAVKFYKKLSDPIPTVAIATSLFVHSMFSNTLVYPWVLGWCVFYLSTISLKENK